ncbi:fungal-specific transcription factor domain-containing protein [Aspergillus bertholletiae]|uniref:Fungal-specific transcription factor domain-containing protein n=1 Tax=Aspergillus bertholletiae TaxID=1226010 RepID=A0A5N7BF63_9EURO|nr:fungal-specific transcription factor domain-containing protein [Aspergillus bertholletiae]
MSLLLLPTELILVVTASLDTQRDINALCQTNRYFYRLLNTRLYRFHVLNHDGSALQWAAKHGQVSTMKKLVDAGANLHEEKEGIQVPIPCLGRWTKWAFFPPPDPLMIMAARYGQESMIEYLLEQGLNPNVVYDNGDTPLSLVAKQGSMSMAQKLLAKGATADTFFHEKCNMSVPPVWEPAGKGDLAMVRVLIENVARHHPTRLRLHLDDALLHAATRGRDNIVDYVLSQGANIEQSDARGMKPLYLAAYNGHESTVRLLFAHGAVIGSEWGYLEDIGRSGNSGIIVAFVEACSSIVDEIHRKWTLEHLLGRHVEAWHGIDEWLSAIPHAPSAVAPSSDNHETVKDDNATHALTAQHQLSNQLASASFINNLLHHFHLEVVSQLTWLDRSDHPWRKVVLPLAQDSLCLRLSILSLSAAHKSVKSANSFILQANRFLHHATLRALNRELGRELELTERSSDRSSLSTILATALVLCYGEMLTPRSTNWGIHLNACRTIIDRYHLQGPRGPGAEVRQFLIKEVMDVTILSSMTSFTRWQSPKSVVSAAPSTTQNHFWTFTDIISEATAVERNRHKLISDGEQAPDEDISLWRDKLDQASLLVSTSASCVFDNETARRQFDAVIRAHYYACYIYIHQALAPPTDKTSQQITYFVRLLFHEIHAITADSSHSFAHALFFPLFIAGTECSLDTPQQALINTIYKEFMAVTGLWCNYSGLQFLYAFWTRSDTSRVTNWIHYARENEDQLGPFLVF